MGVGPGQMAYSYLWGPESREVETEFSCWYIQGSTHRDLFWIARDHVPKAIEIASLNYATSWGPRFETHEPLGGNFILKNVYMYVCMYTYGFWLCTGRAWKQWYPRESE